MPRRWPRAASGAVEAAALEGGGQDSGLRVQKVQRQCLGGGESTGKGRCGKPIRARTVQAFLRTMEDKGLVKHRTEGRAFIYRPALPKHRAGHKLLSSLLEQVFDGAVDQLVESALSLKRPSKGELERLRSLVKEVERKGKRRRS